MNKLALEKSPYLLQHKNNPVNWYPWGSEALNKGIEENKLLFISIGYSTCHWCHVMNRESFNDKEVAEVLNDNFVPIKVDREERPDVDKVYMNFAEAMMGQGGWPLNVIATPEGKPIFIGTYFPKNTKNRLSGLIEVLNKLNSIWSNDKEKVLSESNYILSEVKKFTNNFYEEVINENIKDLANEDLISIYDKDNGGFGTHPKFPMPQYLFFLLNYAIDSNDNKALSMVEDTLEKMYKGGMFDHIGYGFFRYSVDEKWLVPHFEKMLYDNALMSMVYTKAYELTNKSFYKDVAQKIFEFIIRDFLSPEGGFYSALDADSEGVEGKYYLFDSDETVTLLGEEWGNLYNKYYDISKRGNFEGKNIPNLINKDLESANPVDIATLDSITQMLFTYRENRIPPHRDEKILTSWNGLTISSLAKAGMVFDNQFYIKKAKEAADFIIQNSIDNEGNLLSTFVDGVSYNLGFLEDYTFFIDGLLKLFMACSEERYLDFAIKLTDDMIGLFGDNNQRPYYFYSHKSESLVLRPKETYDGAIPSGNSFAIMNFINLFTITKDERYFNLATELIKSYGGNINSSPLAHLYTIVAINNYI